MTTALTQIGNARTIARPGDVEFSRDEINLIKQTVAKGTTDLELNLFLYVSRQRGLNPLLKQIYAIKRWNSKLQKDEMAIQTGIDGFRTIAARTGAYAGNEDPIFDGQPGKPDFKASATVYRIVAGIRCPFSATARWSEYFPGEKQGHMWLKMPHTMIGKCVEALALRKAFPEDLGGLYIHEEMQQAGPAVIEATATPEAPKSKGRQKKAASDQPSEPEPPREDPPDSAPTPDPVPDPYGAPLGPGEVKLIWSIARTNGYDVPMLRLLMWELLDKPEGTKPDDISSKQFPRKLLDTLIRKIEGQPEPQEVPGA
jgi:phage recombination protein Bet